MDGLERQTVRDARAAGDPLPGRTNPPNSGFAGRLATDPVVVTRDVLGRYPLFVDEDTPGEWANSPTALRSPRAVPPGAVLTRTGDGWQTEQVWSLPSPDRQLSSPSVAGERLDDCLTQIVAEMAKTPATTAVAFSGGIDSALIAEALDTVCYVVGFPGSRDIQAARTAATALDVELRIQEVTHEDLEHAIPRVARATGRTNPMDIGIAVSLHLAGRAAAADGFDRLAVGQGADELFGGYEKLVEPASDHRLDAETVLAAQLEVIGTLPAQLARDVLALRAASIEPVAPFLDDRIVALALELEERCLVAGDRRKVTVREAGARRLPAELVEREKIAIQYGSHVSREIDRLARRAGYKRRMTDHVGRYIRSLLD